MKSVIDLTESNNKVVDFMSGVSRRAGKIREAYKSESVEFEIKWEKKKDIYGNYTSRFHYNNFIVFLSNRLLLKKTESGYTYTLRDFKEEIKGDVVGYLLDNAKEIIMSMMDIYNTYDTYSFSCNVDVNAGINAKEYADFVIKRHPDWDLVNELSLNSTEEEFSPRKIEIDGVVYAEGRSAEELKAFYAEEERKKKEEKEREDEEYIKEKERMVREIREVAKGGYTKGGYKVAAINDKAVVLEKDSEYSIYDLDINEMYLSECYSILVG